MGKKLNTYDEKLLLDYNKEDIRSINRIISDMSKPGVCSWLENVSGDFQLNRKREFRMKHSPKITEWRQLQIYPAPCGYMFYNWWQIIQHIKFHNGSLLSQYERITCVHLSEGKKDLLFSWQNSWIALKFTIYISSLNAQCWNI